MKQKNSVFKNPIKTVFAPQVRAKKASVSETEEKEEEKEEAAGNLWGSENFLFFPFRRI